VLTLLFVTVRSDNSSSFEELYIGPPLFEEKHPLIFDSYDCHRGQHYDDWFQFRVKPARLYDSFSNETLTLVKVGYDFSTLPINIFLDWVLQPERVEEFSVYKCKFRTVNFGDFAFFTYLRKVSIVSSTLSSIINRKKHCVIKRNGNKPYLYHSLEELDLSSNKITYLDLNMFKPIVLLKKIDLSDNALVNLENMLEYVNGHPYTREINMGFVHYLPCSIIKTIEKLDVIKRKVFNAKCAKDKVLKCNDTKFDCPIDNTLSPFTHYRLILTTTTTRAPFRTTRANTTKANIANTHVINIWIILLLLWIR